jgi:hypothetical protein
MLQLPVLLDRTCGACSPGWRDLAAAPKMPRCSVSCLLAARLMVCMQDRQPRRHPCALIWRLAEPATTDLMVYWDTVQVAGLLAELLTGASGEVHRLSRLRQMYAVQHLPSVELLQQPQVECRPSAQHLGTGSVTRSHATISHTC